ncbi:MAG: enoyl-CoA hydratase/isomerase family protein [Chloroflexi bacterium]|nr:enoyl-CoA hydratase/isomerase family protein [Chloroflexota bacterium]
MTRWHLSPEEDTVTYETITYDRRDGIGLLTLNRPERLNALNSAMRREVKEVLTSVNDDAEVRVLVITGAGEAFCAGADQRESTSGGAIPLEEIRQRNIDPRGSTSWLMKNIAKPVITAVNGVAVGGGFAIAVGGDVVIASEQARFRVGHAPLGMAMMDGLGWLLPRLIGTQRAFELYATNRIMEGEEAARIGLALKVTPQAQLMQEAMAMARAMAEGPPLGLRQTKRAITLSHEQTLDDYLIFERLAYQNCYFSEDSKEARQAFLERRKPKFQGK